MTSAIDPRIVAEGLHLASPAALGARLSNGRWQRAAHLDYISAHLVDAAFGDIPRLMVHAPPQHGKSEMVSHWFPVWYFALFPERHVIFASYAAEYASEWGRKVRNTIEEFYPELGVTVAEDSRARHRWNTNAGGGMVTAGADGGSITGRPAHLLIIDDPVKDGEQAMSEVEQTKRWNWYRSTAVTRLRPGGIVVIIQTRWDEQDLSGKLLEAMAKGQATEGYDEWRVLRLPAIAESKDDPLGRKEGEALWPGVYDIKNLRAKERSMGPHWFSAEYQQRPTPLGGDLIKEHWWNYWVPHGMSAFFPPVLINGRECRVVELPEMMDKTFQSWDCNFRDSIRAIEEGKEPDAVAGHVWSAVLADFFLRDRFHGRVGLNETIQAVREMSENWPEARVKLVENTANGPAVMARLTKEVGGFVPVTPHGSKVTRVIGTGKTDADRGARAISFAVSVQNGNYYLPHPGLRPWAAEFRTQVGKFPKEGKDDTDAASQAWAYGQGPAWQELEKQHREALEKGEPPESTAEIHRRRIAASLERAKPRNGNGNGQAHGNPWRRGGR